MCNTSQQKPQRSLLILAAFIKYIETTVCIICQEHLGRPAAPALETGRADEAAPDRLVESCRVTDVTGTDFEPSRRF